MNAISGYLWRVVCAAVICALVGAISGDGPGRPLRKLTAGLFLSLAVLSPLGDVQLPQLDTDQIRSDAQEAVRAGTEQATQAKNAIISETMETYIWNKAAQLGLQVQVHVVLNEEGLPRSVELTGAVSPMDRQTLAECITRELGLGKEAQVWIDPYQSSE